jgi:tRNA pseudouridine55 synthase
MKKIPCSGLSKTYDVELLFGIESDTEDALGIVDGQYTVPTLEVATNTIQNFPKKYEQHYPRFSSKPVDGKPLFQHAREGRDVESPTHEVAIASIEIKKFPHSNRKRISGTCD